eukprot:jgi/Tetstr1/440494/TSEL_028820.t1
MLAAMPPSDDTERPSPPLGAGLADPFREDKSGGEAAGAMAAVTISMAAARPAFRSDRVRTEQRGPCLALLCNLRSRSPLGRSGRRVSRPGQLRTQASQGRRRWPGNLASRAMLEGGTPASLLHQVAVLADFDGSVQLREEAGPRKAVEPFWRRASLHLCWVSGGGGAIGGHRTLICLLHEWAHCVHVCCSHHLLVAPNGALEEAEGGLWCAGGGHVSDELEQELIQVR